MVSYVEDNDKGTKVGSFLSYGKFVHFLAQCTYVIHVIKKSRLNYVRELF